MGDRKASRTVPVVLGIAMLAVVLAAGLFPNTGTVQVDTSCPYGGCVSTSSFPVWELVSILVLIAAGAIAAALFLLRRRRPPPSGPVQAWQETPPAGAAAGRAAPGGPSPAAPTPPYVETAEDIGHAPPAISPAATAGAAAAVAAPVAAAGEPDIDSLMAELDKISGEILKKPPKKGGSASVEDDAKSA